MTAASHLQLRRLLESLPAHGGDIGAASARFAVCVDDWVDLSTGINPEPYPVPDMPARVFSQLPYNEATFMAAAKKYYGSHPLLAVAGTQVAIQLLPQLLNPSNALPVLLPQLGYQEHYRQWRAHGALTTHYHSSDRQRQCDQISRQLQNNPLQHLLLIRPNNPTALSVSCDQVLQWSSMLAASAYLIVDEAFIDTAPLESLLCLPELPGNLIVLRSFGKFFGLAGIRLGFMFAKPAILQSLAEQAGLWGVNGPAQFIATQALQDTHWHKMAIERAPVNAATTEQVFNRLFLHYAVAPPRRNPLFLSYAMELDKAIGLYTGLASSGVLTRLVVTPDNRALLRIGCLSGRDKLALEQVNVAIDRLCGYRGLTQLLQALLPKTTEFFGAPV